MVLSWFPDEPQPDEGWCRVHDSPWDGDIPQCRWAESVDKHMKHFECELEDIEEDQ